MVGVVNQTTVIVTIAKDRLVAVEMKQQAFCLTAVVGIIIVGSFVVGELSWTLQLLNASVCFLPVFG